jgi:hypothetical protein
MTTTEKIIKGNKAVNIVLDDTYYIAFYVQVYNGEEQVLDTRYFKTTAGAKRWASKKLS